MGFLKKLGLAVLKGVQIVNGYAGPLAALTPTKKDDQIVAAVQSELALLAGVIAQAEVFGQALSLPGADKLKAAAPAIAQVILGSGLMVGKKVADETLFKAGAEKMAAGLADVLNSLHENGVDTENKAA